MAAANTLAYYDTATITVVKSFVIQFGSYFSLTSSVSIECHYADCLKADCRGAKLRFDSGRRL
jgi:hypothetical protein